MSFKNLTQLFFLLLLVTSSDMVLISFKGNKLSFEAFLSESIKLFF